MLLFILSLSCSDNDDPNGPNGPTKTTWVKTFGGEYQDGAYSVAPTPDGGYIVAGYTSPDGFRPEPYLIKTDASGNLLWQRSDSTINSVGKCAVLCADGGYVVLINADNGGFMEKTNASGSRIWLKPIPDNSCWALAEATDDGYVIAGYGWGADRGPCLAKTDFSGNVEWQKTYSVAYGDEARAVLPTADGGYVLVGHTHLPGGATDAYVVKTDASGNLLWEKTYGGDHHDKSDAVVQTGDGGYVVAGHTMSFGNGSADVYLFKIDSSGNLLWRKTYGGTTWDMANSMVLTADGGFIMAGSTASSGAGSNDIYLVRTDASGNLLWEKTHGGTNQDDASSIAPTADGGYIIAGQCSSCGAGSYDVYLVKTDADGNL